MGETADFGRDPVSGENYDTADGNVIERLNESDAGIHETVDNVLVVNDFVVDVDRLAGEEVHDLLNDVDGHADTRTKTSRIGEDDLHVDDSKPMKRGRPIWGLEAPGGDASGE